MKKLLAIAAALTVLAACSAQGRQLVDVPTFTSPCTLGATCPDGSDVDPTHDHTDEWQNLTCQDACRLLLKDNVDGFQDIVSCEPMRRDEGFWKLTCDYEYAPNTSDGSMGT